MTMSLKAGLESTMANDRWLSVEEIAVHLGVAKDSIYRWIDKKTLPAHKVCKLWKFKREEVDGWVKSGGASDRQDDTDKGRR
jgi:excisionase family DNA binding protein